jgi:hypothetical protein
LYGRASQRTILVGSGTRARAKHRRVNQHSEGEKKLEQPTPHDICVTGRASPVNILSADDDRVAFLTAQSMIEISSDDAPPLRPLLPRFRDSRTEACALRFCARQQRFLLVTDRNQPVSWTAADRQRIREFLARKLVSPPRCARAVLSAILSPQTRHASPRATPCPACGKDATPKALALRAVC